MEYQNYLSKNKKFQKAFLDFMNYEDNSEELYQNLINLFHDLNIKSDKHEFKQFLHFIDNFSNNHFRYNHFFDKIERILLLFTNEFKEYFSNDDIHIIFKNNKRILLFLIKNEIITINCFISYNINNYKDDFYPEFFSTEIKQFVEVDSKISKEPDFEQNRKEGENEHLLCRIIRKDLISEFIVYINKNEISLNSTIKKSIFETNLFLLNKMPTLIEYSAFFGSIQIFKYLFKNGVKLTPSLWLYSIHGTNPEIINILEENKIKPEDKTYKECLIEAIKCHHNEIVNYIETNILQNSINIENLICSKSIDYYNYMYFPDDFYDRNNFYCFCKFGYFYLVELYLKNKKVDINFKIGDLINNESYIITPLLITVKNNNVDIVELLLKNPEIDVNFQITQVDWLKNIFTMNALILAIYNNNPKMVKILLENKNIDVNSIITFKMYNNNSEITMNEWSPLLEAIDKQNIDIVKLLLDHPNIDINMKIKLKRYAADDTIIYINEMYALKKAIEIGNYEIANMIINHPKVDVNIMATFLDESNIIEEELPLVIAIKIDDIEIGKLLLSHPNIDVNRVLNDGFNGKNKLTPLYYAIYYNEVSFVSILLQHKDIDVNLFSHTWDQNNNCDCSESFLAQAILTKDVEIVKLLLSHPNIDVNCKNIINIQNKYYSESHIFRYAIKVNDDEIMNLLLNHPKIDVNVKELVNYSNNSLVSKEAFLHTAIKECNIELIKNILSNPKIDVNIKSYTKKVKRDAVIEKDIPTLHYAIKFKRFDVIQLLISNSNIDVNLKLMKTVLSTDCFFIQEKTMLQFAVVSDNVKVLNILLNYLQKNGKIIENLNELMEITKNDKIKSIIYAAINSNIDKQS